MRDLVGLAAKVLHDQTAQARATGHNRSHREIPERPREMRHVLRLSVTREAQHQTSARGRDKEIEGERIYVVGCRNDNGRAVCFNAEGTQSDSVPNT